MSALPFIIAGWFAIFILVLLLIWSLCAAAALGDEQIEQDRQAEADQRHRDGGDLWLDRRTTR